MADYRQRAEECRRLADLSAGTDHWAAYLEMGDLGKTRRPARIQPAAQINGRAAPEALVGDFAVCALAPTRITVSIRYAPIAQQLLPASGQTPA